MKIRIPAIKLGPIVNYLLVTVLTGLIIATLFLAFPKTESLIPDKILEINRFDLNKKEDEYWRKEFYLKIDVDTEDRAERTRLIRETKNILYKRLKRAGVEEIQMVEQRIDENRILKVVVQTTLDINNVGSLISERGHLSLVLQKEDFIEDENDPSGIYLIENYEDTEWNRNKFRNILIKKLLDSQGGRSFFAIFKTWPQDSKDFKGFLGDNQDRSLGLAIDEFVRPIQANEYSLDLFAIGLGQDPVQAELYDNLFNSGVIPVKYSVIDEKELEAEIFEIDYIQITLAIISSIMILTTFLYFKEAEKRDRIFKFALCLLLLFSTSFTILKLYQIPVDLFLLVIASIMGIIFVKMIYLRIKDLKLIFLLPLILSMLMIFLGYGYVTILGQYLLYIIVASTILQYIVEHYFKLVNTIFR